MSVCWLRCDISNGCAPSQPSPIGLPRCSKIIPLPGDRRRRGMASAPVASTLSQGDTPQIDQCERRAECGAGSCVPCGLRGLLGGDKSAAAAGRHRRDPGDCREVSAGNSRVVGCRESPPTAWRSPKDGQHERRAEGRRDHGRIARNRRRSSPDIPGPRLSHPASSRLRCTIPKRMASSRHCIPWVAWARSRTSSTLCFTAKQQTSSPVRHCMSMAALTPAIGECRR